MDALTQNLSKIVFPSGQTPIYKDECVYTFDTPESPTGLYVNLHTYLGFSEEYASKYAKSTGNNVFLHIKREKKLNEEAKDESKAEGGTEECGPQKKITRLAIGVEGGYKDEARKYEYKDTLSIVVMPDKDTKIPYPSENLPLIVTEAVKNLLQQESAIQKLEKEALSGTWDGEVRQVTKLSDTLIQLDNGKKIPPSGWKCEKCDLTTNLWLNLTDGSILCGRKFFDGSGGNDHAVEHYRETSYPLAVKLGTITGDGKSDVFSYPEDDMVIDSKLEQHLAHFGINMAAMKKSEKSMVELELEINQRIGEWSLLTESDSELQPMSGPGYTGMRNLGNSCYINSVMQVIFTIPDFMLRFVGAGAEKYFSEFPFDPANDFNIQMSKLGNGLWSGKYSSIAENSLDSESTGIAPAMFKNVIGKNHPDFSTKQQQDAYLFYLHFINMLERHSRHQFNPADALTFCLEERIECLTSKKVKYRRRPETALPLLIPLEQATNYIEVMEYMQTKAATEGNTGDKDVVKYKVPLQACLNQFFAPEQIEQFYSPAIKSCTTAEKVTRLASMPDFLMFHMKRFTIGDDWVPKKLDVSVDVPDEIDLSNWRGRGMQPGEEEMPDSSKESPKFEFDQSVMSELMQMGFPVESCKRAIYHTSNSGLEAASNWIMEHIADADISDPFEIPSNSGTSSGSAFVPNAESMAMLIGMGFDERQVIKALKATDGNVERATDWIFSHADDMDTSESVVEEAKPAAASPQYRDGVGKYKLVAFISHMGTSTKVGHYVCHIRKDDQWIIYNDSKVAKSQNPPKDLGYMYLYKREQ